MAYGTKLNWYVCAFGSTRRSWPAFYPTEMSLESCPSFVIALYRTIMRVRVTTTPTHASIQPKKQNISHRCASNMQAFFKSFSTLTCCTANLPGCCHNLNLRVGRFPNLSPNSWKWIVACWMRCQLQTARKTWSMYKDPYLQAVSSWGLKRTRQIPQSLYVFLESTAQWNSLWIAHDHSGTHLMSWEICRQHD